MLANRLEIDSDSEQSFFSRRFISEHAPMLSRRYLYASCASLTAISLFGLLFFTLWAEQPRIIPLVEENAPFNSSIIQAIDSLGPENNLVGLPTARFRGSLYFFRIVPILC